MLCSHLTSAYASTSTSQFNIASMVMWCKCIVTEWVWILFLRQCLHCYSHNVKLWQWRKRKRQVWTGLYWTAQNPRPTAITGPCHCNTTCDSVPFVTHNVGWDHLPYECHFLNCRCPSTIGAIFNKWCWVALQNRFHCIRKTLGWTNVHVQYTRTWSTVHLDHWDHTINSVSLVL